MSCQGTCVGLLWAELMKEFPHISQHPMLGLEIFAEPEPYPLPDARTVLSLTGARIEDCDENHPHGGLKWKSPREFIRAKIETARVPAETEASS